jgi:hypothetical protein
MKTKTCLICKIEKPFNEFGNHNATSSRKRSYCKECDNIKQKNYRKNHKFETIQMWLNTRCYNPNRSDYKYYGGKGIKNFLSLDDLKTLWERDNADLMIRPSIDRIDSDKDYCFENCQFIEFNKNTQERNKRFSKVILQFTLDGNFIREWDSISLASKTLKINLSCISNVINFKRNTAGGFKWGLKNLFLKYL